MDLFIYSVFTLRFAQCPNVADSNNYAGILFRFKVYSFFSCSPLVKHYRVIRKHDGGFIIDVEPKVSINTKAQFWVQLYMCASKKGATE